MLRTQRLEACAQHVSRSGPGRSRRRLGRGGSPPKSRAARADRSDRPRRTSVRESDDGPRVVQDRPAREVAAVVAGQDREARVRPEVGRQHAHGVVVLVPPSHHVGVEDANPAGRRSGCCDATVVKPCGGEEQVDSGPSSGPTSSQPSASAVVRPRPTTEPRRIRPRSGAGRRCRRTSCGSRRSPPEVAAPAPEQSAPGQWLPHPDDVEMVRGSSGCPVLPASGAGDAAPPHGGTGDGWLEGSAPVWGFALDLDLEGWATARQRSSRVQCRARRGSEIRPAGLLRTLKRVIHEG